MPPSDDAGRILELLTTLIAMRGLRLRDLETSVGLSAGTLRRVLKGTIELKFRHITDLLAVLDIPTKTFFRIAFDSEDPAQAQLLLAQTLRIPAEPRPVMLDPQQIEAVVVATMQRLGFPSPSVPATAAAPSQHPAPATTKPRTKTTSAKRRDEDPETPQS
jgi:transcriptional regulator with XRE-family HTH domain